ncbi:Hypothetical protein SMAX5B_002810 [Scophthalmus maximus]|uniref:Uncharacterized protein n=1 Tax=Scophthalmus maximus TaxID=52904 RepID=A0A2U9BEU5_SCOMX|nr:Hypothetical protein SMAX5B_002810 [Scophthalmus maximus]
MHEESCSFRHQLRGGAGSRLITLTETRHKVLTCRTSDGPRPPPGSAGPSSTPRHRQQPTQHLLTFGNFGEPRRTLESILGNLSFRHDRRINNIPRRVMTWFSSGGVGLPAFPASYQSSFTPSLDLVTFSTEVKE